MGHVALASTALKRLFTGQSVAHSSPQLRTGLQLSTRLRREHPLCSTLPDKCAAIVQRRWCCGTGSWNQWRTTLKLSLADLAISFPCLIYVGVKLQRPRRCGMGRWSRWRTASSTC